MLLNDEQSVRLLYSYYVSLSLSGFQLLLILLPQKPKVICLSLSVAISYPFWWTFIFFLMPLFPLSLTSIDLLSSHTHPVNHFNFTSHSHLLWCLSNITDVLVLLNIVVVLFSPWHHQSFQTIACRMSFLKLYLFICLFVWGWSFFFFFYKFQNLSLDEWKTKIFVQLFMVCLGDSFFFVFTCLLSAVVYL